MAEKSREWRPGNWENPHNMAHAIYPNSTLLLLPDGRQVEGGYANSIGLESYEEGADAMFAAMKQEGYLSPDEVKAEREQREAKPNTGDYRKAEGVLPLTPGSELPEETIRRMRDGLPSRVTDNELRANLKHLLMSETPLTPWNKADYIIDRIIALIDEHHKAHPYQRMPSGRREVNMNKTCSMCGHEATKGETFTIFFNPTSEWGTTMFDLPQYCDQCLPKIQVMRLRAKLKNEEQARRG